MFSATRKLFWVAAAIGLMVSVAFAADSLRRFDAVALGPTTSSNARLNFAPSTTSAGGINFGDDVALYRSAANKLASADPFDLVFAASSGTAVTDFLSLTNTKNAASMTGTGAGILFNQWYYDGTTPALVDAGRLSFSTAGNWTSTASTQDAICTLSTVINGTQTTLFSNSSAGLLTLPGDVTFGDAATDQVVITGDLTVNDDAQFDDAVALNGAVTVGNASTDTMTCTGRFFVRSVTDAGPMTATNGTIGEIVFETSTASFYGCSVTGTPATWVKLTN